MKFNKPINRDVEIAGNEFVVGMDDTGITFRLKGKRKVVRVNWQGILDMARGENGELPSTYLGLGNHPAEKPATEPNEPSSLAFGHSAGGDRSDG